MGGRITDRHPGNSVYMRKINVGIGLDQPIGQKAIGCFSIKRIKRKRLLRLGLGIIIANSR